MGFSSRAPTVLLPGCMAGLLAESRLFSKRIDRILFIIIECFRANQMEDHIGLQSLKRLLVHNRRNFWLSCLFLFSFCLIATEIVSGKRRSFTIGYNPTQNLRPRSHDRKESTGHYPGPHENWPLNSALLFTLYIFGFLIGFTMGYCYKAVRIQAAYGYKKAGRNTGDSGHWG